MIWCVQYCGGTRCGALLTAFKCIDSAKQIQGVFFLSFSLIDRDYHFTQWNVRNFQRRNQPMCNFVSFNFQSANLEHNTSPQVDSSQLIYLLISKRSKQIVRKLVNCRVDLSIDRTICPESWLSVPHFFLHIETVQIEILIT